MIKRKNNWQQAFEIWLKRSNEYPFQWGVNDCAMAAANCVYLLTGADPAKPYRHKYKDAIGAMRIIKKHGNGSLLGLIDKSLEGIGQSIDPINAKQGDVVVAKLFNGTDERETAGICNGSTSLFPSDRGGLFPFPTRLCIQAWRIG